MGADAVERFEHDHVGFSAAVTTLRSALERSRGDDATSIIEAARALEDALLTHFAREEEGLFPFVLRCLPDLSGAIDELLRGHDVVCGCLVRLGHLLSRPDTPERRADALALFARFDEAYAKHGRDEVALLRAVGSRLTKEQRSELSALVESL